MQIFVPLLFFLYIQQIKTFKESHNINMIKQINKKSDIVFLTLIEKSKTIFEIILKTNILSSENFSFNLKIFVKK